ncbi:hypothetical protein H6P81_020105 [Aristolochia fimbriata]|uniref:Plant thionin family protein n=1 Tax=Aristolochia fimbriata TaxID=158543 RepID=A0AAV7DTH3_ARIFI|nr:hypothetical protein H6P81_020105 [Aristolochia fimbriata]
MEKKRGALLLLIITLLLACEVQQINAKDCWSKCYPPCSKKNSGLTGTVMCSTACYRTCAFSGNGKSKPKNPPDQWLLSLQEIHN